MCKRNKILILLFTLIQIGCTKTIIYNVPLYDAPIDWKEYETRKKTISEFSKYLTDKKIFLDAGHGGEDRRNKSRNGEVIEADVNLRVVLNLKNYLEQAGAKVFLSRDKDTTVQLGYRSELANKSGADLFISIHHNAPSKVEDYYTNYTSVYYHAFENDYEHEPCNKDLARYIQRDLSYVMNNPGGLGSFDGTYSDYIIYPKEGFSVLRKTKSQAVLVECAFHTSRLEELRLNNEEFNQIQAWGIFRGIAKYFRAGIPNIKFLEDSTNYTDSLKTIKFKFDDQDNINNRSIQVFYNKEENEFYFNRTEKTISIPLIIKNEKYFEIKMIAANSNGNHLRKTFYKFKIDSDGKIKLIE
ncbi:MAG: N-acetylmuramoyl-L-alanine amidase [Melioribacteraceae bacterium]|nr:N-acetylmuramoyl-L-alanine amidase [Melioribacteraceae bacterium]